MKTATIRVYEMFGTRNSFCVDAMYRGKVLFSKMQNGNPQELCDIARRWAHSNGFTHCRVSFG